MNTYHLGVGRVEQFMFFEKITTAKNSVALQAPVLAGYCNRGWGRRRRSGSASTVQVFF